MAGCGYGHHTGDVSHRMDCDLKLPHSPDNGKWKVTKEILRNLTLANSVQDIKDLLLNLYCQSHPRQHVQSFYQTPFLVLLDIMESRTDTELGKLLRVQFPTIAWWAIRVENCPVKISRLPQGKQCTVEIKTAHVASIVACGFLCLLIKDLGFQEYFYLLYQTKTMDCSRESRSMETKAYNDNRKLHEKMKFFLNYFEHLGRSDSKTAGKLKIQRICLDQTRLLTFEILESKSLCELTVSNSKIEESGDRAMIVDFANKRIGGGVFQNGTLQEEILFLTCPELLITVALCDPMNDNEAIVVGGFSQMAEYTGYGPTLHFHRPVRGRVQLTMCAIDAQKFDESSSKPEMEKPCLLREINKAYAGFQCHNGRLIATGNWGCGFFQGNTQLKAVIQWIAASQAQCPQLIYHTYGHEDMRDLDRLVREVKRKNWSVGELWRNTYDYCKDKTSLIRSTHGQTLFQRLLDGKPKEPKFKEVIAKNSTELKLESASHDSKVPVTNRQTNWNSPPEKETLLGPGDRTHRDQPPSSGSTSTFYNGYGSTSSKKNFYNKYNNPGDI